MVTKPLSTMPSTEFNDDIKNLMNAVKADINKRVGIGTSSPSQKLDVAGSSQIGTPVFTGSGLNDLTLGGEFNQPYTQTLRIEIDGTGTPDTFKWSVDGGSTWVQTGVAITGSAQDLHYIGVSVTFANTTGHTVGDYWQVTLTPASGIVNAEGTVFFSNAQKLTAAGGYGLAIGNNIAASNVSKYIIAIGYGVLRNNVNGTFNIAISSSYALYSNTTGSRNIAIGAYALNANQTGYNNIAIGYYSLCNITASTNIGIGTYSGRYIADGSANQTGSNSVFIGYNTKANADGETNEIVIGANQIGYGSNTVRIGNLGLGQIGTTLTPRNNHDLVIELTANDTLTFRLKGTDGTVRSASLTLS